jgi:ribosome-associated protein
MKDEREIRFKIHTDYIELIGLLKATAVAESGAQAKQIVDEGMVRLNGEKESRKRAKLKQGDRIVIRDITIIVD